MSAFTIRRGYSALRFCQHGRSPKATAELISANHIVDGYVRPIAWRGAEQMAYLRKQPKSTLLSPHGIGRLISHLRRVPRAYA